MTIRLLLVLGDQRSGTTFLSETLARAIPCAVALGEPLLDKLDNAGAGGHLSWPFAKRLDPVLRRRRFRDPYPWLVHLHSYACAQRACGCVGVAKIFRTHPVALKGMRDLMDRTDVAGVILERNATDVECSMRWAERTGDWALTPQERQQSGRRADYHAFKTRCAPTSSFAALHDAWYTQLRRMPGCVNVGFDVLMRDTTATLNRIASAFAFNLTASRWVPQGLEDAPVPPQTLALVIIVRRQAERFAPWLSYHARAGASEVAVYSTPATRAVVARVAKGAALRVLHWSLGEAVAAFGGRNWSYSWRSCTRCCHVPQSRRWLVRPAPDPNMCARRMYMPEQAHVVRHASTRLASIWLMHIDLDEYLISDGSAPNAWRAYVATLQARARRPGGVRVPQLQVVRKNGSTIMHLIEQRYRWEEHKCLLRRDALHPDAHAFGAIHEVTLKPGEFYVRASGRLLALLHFRYDGWRRNRSDELQARLSELGCGVSHPSKELALICRDKRAEFAQWGAQLIRRPRQLLAATRAALIN